MSKPNIDTNAVETLKVADANAIITAAAAIKGAVQSCWNGSVGKASVEGYDKGASAFSITLQHGSKSKAASKLAKLVADQLGRKGKAVYTGFVIHRSGALTPFTKTGDRVKHEIKENGFDLSDLGLKF